MKLAVILTVSSVRHVGIDMNRYMSERFTVQLLISSRIAWPKIAIGPAIPPHRVLSFTITVNRGPDIKAPDKAMRRDEQNIVIRVGIMLLLYFVIGLLSLLFLAKQVWRIESKAQEGCFFWSNSLNIEDTDA